MPKQTFFHGTSADNLPRILREGIRVDCEKIWTPSRNEVYLWSPAELTRAGECEEGWQDDCARERAYDSAQCALAKAKDCRAVVFEVEIDSDLTAEDDSCENMTGAVCCSVPIDPKQIKRIWISDDLSLLRGYFIHVMTNLNLSALRFTAIEVQIAKLFGNGEFYFDSSDFPLKSFVLKGKRLIEEAALV